MLFFSINSLKNTLLIEKLPICILQVNSGSMDPNIRQGEAIVVIKKKDYNIGDIITYQTKDKKLITHRIVEKTKQIFFTKGDSNNRIDEEEIKLGNIKGKVVFHSKILGIITKYHKIILFCLLLFIVLER